MNKLNFLQPSLIFIFLFIGCEPSQPNLPVEASLDKVKILSPEDLYGDFFYEVQTRTDLFPDSKTFVDATPKRKVEDILLDYRNLENKESSDVMMAFLKENFQLPGYAVPVELPKASSPSDHITNLWSFLERPTDPYVTGTKIPLPNTYVVPGGRFREVYYWDSYFTMLGLKVDGEGELITNIVANFSYLIDSIGFVPNGNRTYYHSRSQPPFYALMVALNVEDNPNKTWSDYHDYLLKEYNFWMEGAAQLNDSNRSYRRVVAVQGGVLNRYWDDKDTPRPESYREDVETVREAMHKYPDRTEETFYRHLRAAAESGWDFSSRWFEIEKEGVFDLSTIHTTDIIPVDLNSLLYYLEQLIAMSFQEKGLSADSEAYLQKAQTRKELIVHYCWNEAAGFFMDYDFVREEQTSVKSLAGLYPLFFEIAAEDQAEKVAVIVQDQFLMKGGVVTTLNASGQQWDFPNGWAPLQWMTIQGLRNYNKTGLADEIKRRWLDLNTHVFENTGKMTEKYNVVDMSLAGGGGEYPNQDGFGWTNGVFQRLYKENEN